MLGLRHAHRCITERFGARGAPYILGWRGAPYILLRGRGRLKRSIHNHIMHLMLGQCNAEGGADT